MPQVQNQICLCERLSFDKLFRFSEPKRVKRSLTVKGPPLEIDSYQDTVYYAFNFKSNPSTTGLRHRGYIKFFKPRSGTQQPLQHLECEVDCTCPDFRYRWAWVLKQHKSSRVGPSSLNQAWNKAPKITNPARIPGLCKHILAAREYIYGLLSAFPSNAPDTAEKLNKLTKFATKRWTNFDAQMQAAKEKEARLKTAKEMRRRGQLPPISPQSFANRIAPPSQRGRELPPPLPAPDEEPENRVKAPALPRAGRPRLHPEPPAAGSTKYAASAKKAGFQSAAAMKAAKTIGDSLSAENQKSKPESVDISKGLEPIETMNALDESVKIIENLQFRQRRAISEMHDDEFDSAAPPESGAGDEPLDDDPNADALPPSEPPVSDTAVGADTEGQVVLGLLADIKDLLGQLVAVQAPEEIEGDEAGEEGDENEPLEDEDGAVDANPESPDEDETDQRPGAHLSTP
jgi:hypothetical protein